MYMYHSVLQCYLTENLGTLSHSCHTLYANITLKQKQNTFLNLFSTFVTPKCVFWKNETLRFRMADL